ncbi:uncharacterized protein LJ206_007826 [Theristicus caerulescens]
MSEEAGVTALPPQSNMSAAPFRFPRLRGEGRSVVGLSALYPAARPGVGGAGGRRGAVRRSGRAPTPAPRRAAGARGGSLGQPGRSECRGRGAGLGPGEPGLCRRGAPLLAAPRAAPLPAPARVWKISVMGQEAETEFKLELVASINEELEQTHLGHRKGWLKKESEQAVNNSGLETDMKDYGSTCSDSGHVAKRRKMNHLAIQKTEQYLNQMHKDSIKLTERILALEEQSL